LPNDVSNASVLLRVTPQGAFEEVRLDLVKHMVLGSSVSDGCSERQAENYGENHLLLLGRNSITGELGLSTLELNWAKFLRFVVAR